MTLADEIAAVVAEVRPVYEDAALPDSYRVLAVTKVSNGRGGSTETTTEIETGRCVLEAPRITSQGQGIVAEIVQTGTLYTAELPMDTALTTEHVLAVNGRRFDVVDVQRDGLFGIAVTAVLKERS